MHLLNIVLVSFILISGIVTEDCKRPISSLNKRFYIYRISPEIDVSVYKCDFKNENGSFVDITDRCLNAFKTGIYVDSVGNKFDYATNSYFQFKQITAKADPVRNEIRLPSGTVRYNRGVSPGPELAIWDVSNINYDNLDEIFSGNVFLWEFENREYIIYKQPPRFYHLELVSKSQTNGIDIWTTDVDGIIVSLTNLNAKTHSGLFQKYLPSQPLSPTFVKSVLELCDRKTSPLDITINALRKEFNNVKVSINSQSKHIDNISVTVSNLQNNVVKQDTTENLKTLFGENFSKIKSKEEEQDVKIGELTNTLKEKVTEITTLSNKCDICVNKNAATTTEISELKKNIQDLKTKFLGRDLEISLLHKHFKDFLNQYKARNETLENFLASLKTKELEQDAKHIELEKILIQKETDIAALIEQCDLQQNSISTKDLEIAEMKKNLSNIQDKMNKKEGELLAIEKNLKGVNDQLKSNNVRMETLAAELVKSNEKYQSLKALVTTIEENMNIVIPN